MVDVKSGGTEGPAQRRPLAVIAVAAAVVVAAAVAWYLLTTWGGGSIGPPPTPTGVIPVPQEVKIVFNDLNACKQSDCVCATPDFLPTSRLDVIEWVNTTSAKVTITPSKSDTFVSSTGPSGSVGVDGFKTLSTTISSTLKVGDMIQLTLTLDGDLKLCEGTQGPRMEIDN